MEKYDIIHLEDDHPTAFLCQRAITKAGLTYHNVQTLAELEQLLHTAAADLYILDGSFPLQPGVCKSFLADRATGKIRNLHPQAKILIYSGNNPEKFDDLPHVEYLGKDTSFDDLVQKIHSLLKQG